MPEDIDSLAHLEQQISRVVEHVSVLRKQNAELAAMSYFLIQKEKVIVSFVSAGYRKVASSIWNGPPLGEVSYA